jgi:hypothetical protein
MLITLPLAVNRGNNVGVSEIQMYWSKNEMFMNLQIKKAMARDVFLQLQKYWYFCDDTMHSDDELHKVHELLGKLNSNFRKAVRPGRDVVTNESMVPWHFGLVLWQYVPNKTLSYDTKLYQVCFPGGCTCITVHSGKCSIMSDKGYACAITLELLNVLLGEGHVLYASTFCTCVPLDEDLLSEGMFLCGAVRCYRRGVPAKVVRAKDIVGHIAALKSKIGM